jgi:peptide subunit release factor 1 (eRF1)
VLTAELAAAFQSLEVLVVGGRQTIGQEQRRQATVRAENAASLDQNLSRLAKQHAAEVCDGAAQQYRPAIGPLPHTQALCGGEVV